MQMPSIKRIFDFICSSVLIIFLFPLMIMIIGACLVFHGRPIIFSQERPGLKGRLFTIYKFRSMKDKKDSSGKLLPDELRITKFGKFLRSSSLDELPSLFLVLTGKMSLVGPRPLLKEYLPLYNKYQMKRHDVLPGITGLSQVSGRNLLSWKEKFDLDVFYVENHNIFMDIKILFKTFRKVIVREGITSKSSESMEVFKGNE